MILEISCFVNPKRQKRETGEIGGCEKIKIFIFRVRDVDADTKEEGKREKN